MHKMAKELPVLSVFEFEFFIESVIGMCMCIVDNVLSDQLLCHRYSYQYLFKKRNENNESEIHIYEQSLCKRDRKMCVIWIVGRFFFEMMALGCDCMHSSQRAYTIQCIVYILIKY